MRIGFAVLAFATILPAAHAATPLRSPWDGTPVAVTSGAYSCPSVASLPHDIQATSFYSDSKHSVTDPAKYAAYKDAQGQFDDVMRASAKAADTFRATGSKAAAECTLTILKTQAAADAMTGTMSSNQANYLQNWTLGALAVAWLKVRSAEPGTPADRKAVTAWMDTVGVQVRAYFQPRHERTPPTNDATNNHYYWAGFAAEAAGVAADDRKLYDWGSGTYEEALSRVVPDGTLPLEIARGQRALHYHLFALAPIIMLAEFGEANGQAAYAMHKGVLHMLVKRTLAGLIDNSYFAKAAAAKQDTSAAEELKSNDLVWLVPYLRRFPDPDASKLLARVDVKPDNYLGGYPPGWNRK